MSQQRDVKEFYKTWEGGWSDQIWPLNEKVAEVVKSYNPKSVLEFGAGLGKHESLLKGIDYFGIDINPLAVKTGRAMGRAMMTGDETLLSHLPFYDVAFTCSVLNHIPKIDGIVHDLKMLAKKAVVLAETKDVPDDKVDAWRYFPHNYEDFGFKKLDYEWHSFHRLQHYHIYVWNK